jgi:glycosyltransferase involved in cell wall biosynthesis
MRIALVVSGGFDPSGRDRVTPSLLWLVERLARVHDVHVFVLHYHREPRDYPLLGATVHDLGRADRPRGLTRFRQRLRLSAALRAQRPFDVLHGYQGLPAAAAVAAAERLDVPVVATIDSGELTAIDDIRYGLQRRWFDRRAVAAALRGATRVTVGTAFMARMIPPGLATAPVEVVPLGIELPRFPASPLAEGPPWRLLRVGSINHVKNYPLLLRAVAACAARGLDTHLDIVGEDTLNGEMQTLAHTLGLDARVTFHGFQSNDGLGAFYRRAHLHVVSSHHEAASIAVLEAAAAGVPTVGTAVGYVADWHPDRAVSVPSGDPGALAAAIGDLLADRARRERIAGAARAWTLAHDADWTAAQFERIYVEAARS